jgi:phenylpropionate dioxygenase-like ring-hydroxylating dioxygenase large terminal subunit
VAVSSARDLEQRVSRGEGLPAAWYFDQGVARRELRHVFGRSWQYVGSQDRLSEPGSYFTSRVASTPIVVVRDTDSSVRAFANVCAHRGHAVAEGEGCRRSLQCRYHGWTYGLDGRLRSAPRTQDDPTFDPSAVELREFAIATWGPLIFVNPDPRTSFNEATAGIRDAAARRGFDPGMYPRRAHREHELRCNWKVTLDNNTECYHCATIHPSFAREYFVDNQHYIVEAFDEAFTHESPMKRSDNTTSAPDFHLYYLWPNFMLSARRLEYFYTYHYRPISATRTLQINDYFFPADWPENHIAETIDQIAVIMREDWAAFESVQEGVESGALEHLRVLPKEEALLCHFQTMLGRALCD